MKKLFMVLLISIFSLSSLTLINAEEENKEVVVKNFSGATREGNVFTMTSSRTYIHLDGSGVDVTKEAYLSVKFTANGIQNFDVVAYGKDANDGDVQVDVISGVVLGEYSKWNTKEHKVFNSFTVSTSSIHGDMQRVGFAQLNYLEIKVRGTEGNTFELMDYIITTDGVHNFDLTDDSGSEDGEDTTDPEVPVKPVYTFKSNTSGIVFDGNVGTFKSTELKYGGISTEFTPVTDITSIYYSMKFRATGVTTLQTVAYDSTGAYSYCGNIYPSKGSKVTIADYEEGFTVITANMSSYLAANGLIDLAKITFNIQYVILI